MMVDVTENFEIYESVLDHRYEKNKLTCFEVDENFALIIQMLNRKGYYTYGCCSGHPVELLCNNYSENLTRLNTTFSVGVAKRAFIMFCAEYELGCAASAESSRVYNCDLRKNVKCLEWFFENKSGTFELQNEITNLVTNLEKWAECLPSIATEEVRTNWVRKYLQLALAQQLASQKYYGGPIEVTQTFPIT
jgi:hypothetical protein